LPLNVEISQPVLILVVGSAGLASNIIGLVLFHDHEGHSHSHGESNSQSDVEAAPTTTNANTDHPALQDGNISDILPETIVRRASMTASKPRPDRSPVKSKRASRQSFASADDIFVSPSANRRSILNQAHEIQSGYAEEEDGDDGYNGDTSVTLTHTRNNSIPHEHHNHAKPKDSKKDSHSHQNLNMRGVFLHVLGDALGNIGVIATALFIWLTDFKWRFYSDPVISLVITAIIFSSALPLVKSASLILLQGVPRGISIDDVKEDILHVLPPSYLSNSRLME
jgi:zinc transporter 1